jgi:hypothetical protein
VANVEEIKESDKRAVYTYYKKKKASTGGTARSYVSLQVLTSDSGQVTLVDGLLSAKLLALLSKQGMTTFSTRNKWRTTLQNVKETCVKELELT